MRAPKCAATCSGEWSFKPGSSGARASRRADLERRAQRADLRRSHPAHGAQLGVARARQRVERAEALDQRVRDPQRAVAAPAGAQ